MDYKDEMRIDNFTWNYMINAGFREVGEDEIVIKKSEYETLKAQNDTLELAVKDLRYRNAQFSEANKLFAKRNDELLDELQGATAIKEKTAIEVADKIYNKLTESDVWHDMKKIWWRHNNECYELKGVLKQVLKELGIELE